MWARREPPSVKTRLQRLGYTEADTENPDSPAYYWEPKYFQEWYLDGSAHHVPMIWPHDVQIEYAMDTYEGEATKAFWKDWVRREIEMDAETSSGGDGYYTFANNLTWFDRRVDHHGLMDHKMYIAYAYNNKQASTKQILIAVCVLVEPGAVYTTMGITKSYYARGIRETTGICGPRCGAEH